MAIRWFHRAGLRKGEAVFDLWSWVHFSACVVIGVVAIPAVWAVAMIVGYEVLEGGLRHIQVKEGGLFEYESWPNIGGDIVAGLAGYFLGLGAYFAAAG